MHKLCQRVKHFEEPLTLKKAIPPPATAFVLREDDEVSQVKPLEQITGRAYNDRSENLLEILMKKYAETKVTQEQVSQPSRTVRSKQSYEQSPGGDKRERDEARSAGNVREGVQERKSSSGLCDSSSRRESLLTR